MTATTVSRDAITARLRECWVREDNLRLSAEWRWAEPCLRAVAVESVAVAEGERRRGVFKRFLADLCRLPGYDLFVVEAVRNPVLADALMRWGWDCDPGVMDFYFRPGVGKEPTT